MAQRRLRNTGYHSPYEEHEASRRYLWPRSFSWGVLLLTLIVTAAGDLFAQGSVSSATASTPIEFNILADDTM